jgi:predicted HD phosphohydrolase
LGKILHSIGDLLEGQGHQSQPQHQQQHHHQPNQKNGDDDAKLP